MIKYPPEFFEPKVTNSNLKEKAASGVVTLVVSQGISILLTVGVGAILARLLTPEDFGLYAMAGAGIGFVHLFKDFGLSAAVVQAEKLNHQLVSTLFWINLAVSCLLTLVAAALAPVLVWFFSDQRLLHIVLFSSLAFLGTGLGLQHHALLSRTLRFGAALKISVATGLLSATIGIGLAACGWGVWALVIAGIANPYISSVLACVATRWWPSLPTKGTGVREKIGYGANLTLFEFINWFARNLDNVIIGKFLGSLALGYYSKAYGLLLMPLRKLNGPFTGALFPILSRTRDEPERYKRFYYHGTQMLLAISWPAVAFLVIVADEVVLILLGRQWLESVSIFRALGVAAMVGCTNILTSWAYRSLGHVDRQLKAVAIQTPLIAGSFFVGLPWGVEGVAWSYSCISLLVRIPYVGYCYRNTFLSLREVWNESLLWPLLSTAVASVLTYVILEFFLPEWGIVLRLLILGLVYGAGYVFMWLGFSAGCKRVVTIWRSIEHVQGFDKLQNVKFIRVFRKWLFSRELAGR